MEELKRFSKSMNNNKSFKKITWGKQKETEVEFQINDTLPPTELISTCFVIPYYKGKLVLTRFEGGWAFAGGHIEEGETAIECLRRECMEESSIVLGEPKLVGRWVATRKFVTDFNREYPDVAYQLQYVAEVKELKEFNKTEEFLERTLIDKKDLRDYYIHYDKHGEVLDYVVENYID